MGVIPVVNENDTVSTYEMQFGDNDTLSAIVASLTGADLLILLSDIDGLFTDDPRKNPAAELVKVVEKIDSGIYDMAKGSTGSDVGTGGMSTKLTAAKIATASGADMVIALSHLGYDSHSDIYYKDRGIAKQTRHIDMIIGGHSHTFINSHFITSYQNFDIFCYINYIIYFVVMIY